MNILRMAGYNIVGHRGAGFLMPENTLISFQKAIVLNLFKTEMDVWMSKDNAVVVFHDDTVDRVTDGKGRIEDKTLDEIKQLNLDKNQKIPTLQEVIEICKGKIDIQIELKGKGTPKPVLNLILKNNIMENVLVTSFEFDLLTEMRSLNKEIKLGFLFDKIPENLNEIVKDFDYICPNCEFVTNDLIKNSNKKIYVFNVQTKEKGLKLLEMGVDEIGTDYPDLFNNSKTY